MSKEELLKGFSDYLQYEKRYSPHTVEAYTRDIHQFEVYILEQYGFTGYSEVRHVHIRSWIVSMIQQKKTSVSVRRKISALSHFFKWQRKKGWLDVNPMVKVQLPKIPARLPKAISETSLEKLWDRISARDNPVEYPALRDGAMLSLLYGGGLRRSELTNLTWSDLDEARGLLRIVGKGKKYRQVPIDKNLFAQLTELRKMAESIFGQADFVILTDTGKPSYPKFVYNRVVQLLSTVTTADKKSPHVLRHSMATHLMDHGAELKAVKELLGHASLSSTEIYTHNSIARIKDIYRQAHPGAGK